MYQNRFRSIRERRCERLEFWHNWFLIFQFLYKKSRNGKGCSTLALRRSRFARDLSKPESNVDINTSQLYIFRSTLDWNGKWEKCVTVSHLNNKKKFDRSSFPVWRNVIVFCFFFFFRFLCVPVPLDRFSPSPLMIGYVSGKLEVDRFFLPIILRDSFDVYGVERYREIRFARWLIESFIYFSTHRDSFHATCSLWIFLLASLWKILYNNFSSEKFVIKDAVGGGRKRERERERSSR